MTNYPRCGSAIGAMMIGVLALAGLTGCEQYAIRGSVIEGPESLVTIVKADDPRLTMQGVNGVVLSFRVDPRSLGSKDIGSTASRPDGSFELTPDVFGAGTLEYELGVLARTRGYNSAEGTVKMPGSNQRLLVILAQGIDRYRKPEDPLSDIDRFNAR